MRLMKGNLEFLLIFSKREAVFLDDSLNDSRVFSLVLFETRNPLIQGVLIIKF